MKIDDFLAAAKQVDIGDVKSRKKLIDDLKCHSFQWFIDNVYKDSPFPNKNIYVGQVRLAYFIFLSFSVFVSEIDFNLCCENGI
jgi:hypothetical protein